MHRPFACLALLLSSACVAAMAPAVKAGPVPAAQGAVPAVFSTQAEAEAAAPRFGCKGAHRMGDQWMPCASHAKTLGGAHQGMTH